MTKYPVEVAPTFAVLLPLFAFIWTKSFLRKSLRYLFIYLIFKLVIDVAMIYMASIRESNLYLDNLEMSLRCFLFMKMFQEAFKLHRNKKVILWCMLTYSTVLIRDVYFYGFEKSLPFIGLAESIILIGLSVIYFIELISLLEIVNLHRYPVFYVVSSVLMFYCGMLFLTPLWPYLNKHPYNFDMNIFILVPYFLEVFSLIIFSVGLIAEE